MIVAAVFVLASATFAPNRTMPVSAVYSGCGGANRAPELHWSGAPAGTKSFALIVHDPDAPHPGGWYHWVLYNLPPGTRELQGGRTQRSNAAPGAGANDFKDDAYDGPCPPPGKAHHYVFSLYALDRQITGTHLDAPALQKAMRGHILARAQLTGLYGR